MTVRRSVLRRLVLVAVTGGSGVAACLPALASGERPVLSLGVAATVLVVLAVATGSRWLGSAAVLGATGSVLAAATLAAERVSAVHLLAASALLLVLVAGLDRTERRHPRGVVVVWRAPARQVVVVPAAALLAAAGVALAASQSVAPSVGLALVGLAASLVALVVATRAT